MWTWTRRGATLAASAALAIVCSGAQAQDAAGDWHGAVSMLGGPPASVAVTLKAKAGGGYEGSYVTPTSVTPLDQVKVDKGTLSFSIAATRMSFSGRWDEAQKAWVGEWRPPFAYVPEPGSATSRAPPAPPMPLVLTAGKP